MTASTLLQRLLAQAPPRPADLVQQIEALAALGMRDLKARYVELFGSPPRIHHREFLLRRCARKLEERRLGGLSPWALAQLERRMELLDLPWRTQSQPPITPPAPPPTQAPPLREPGVVYERIWHGERIRVVEREGAFVWKGETYTSLSAVARAVTGQHWNGLLFFGLRTRTRKAPTLAPKAGDA